MKFQVGDVVKCVNAERSITIKLVMSKLYVVENLHGNDSIVITDNEGQQGARESSRFELVLRFPCKIPVNNWDDAVLIQEWLFSVSKDVQWVSGGRRGLQYTRGGIAGLSVSKAGYLSHFTQPCIYNESQYPELTIEFEKTVKRSHLQLLPTPELIEFNGKKYDKDKLEQALSLLEHVE